MNTPQNNGFTILEDDKSDLKQEFRKYLRYWPWFVLALIMTLISAYIYIRYAPRIYQTTAKIKVLDESDGLALPTAAFIFKRSNINLANEIEILNSYVILEKVAKELKLNTLFFEEGTIQTLQIAELPFYFKQGIAVDSIPMVRSYIIDVKKESFEITHTRTREVFEIPDHNSFEVVHDLPFEIRMDDEESKKESIGKRYTVIFKPLKAATLNLKSSLAIGLVGEQSDLLSLSMKGQSKFLSERILNKLIEVFDNDGIKDRQLVSQRTLDFIDDRFFYLATELDSIEVGRKEFKERNNLVDLAADVTMGLQQRSQSDEEVFQVERQVVIVEMLQKAMNNYLESGLLPANIGLESGNINTLIDEFNVAVLERDKLIRSGGENNPTVKFTQSYIFDLRSNITKSLSAYLQQIKVTQSQLKSRNQKFAGRVSQIPEKEKLLRAIERQQMIKESLYLYLLQKREEAAINLAIVEPSIKVVDYALSSPGPVTPKPNIAYAAAILAGLFVPFTILYLIFMVDTKIHGKEDIVKLNNRIPIIAEIPDISKREKAIFVDPNDRTVLAESFRILSSNVNYLLPVEADEKGKIIYCTSTIKGEGKTFISINLSLALSSMNKRVLLIGADLRNPQIHTHTKFDKNTVGLSDYLHDASVDWKDVLIQGFQQHENHDILLSGNIPPNPTNLLTNGRFKALIEEAKDLYDYVIVDTAPTVLVTDTMLISQLADVTVYISRANYTEKKILSFAEELFESGKIKNMAYVINGVGASRSYGYGYNYGYGYGYGAKETT
ncbi:GumC family protein [Psychroserpens jangbogonensis]|uniref:GumC family protein n=1 Tax=Psychroserpens jangbogonensis TaxID=1484460 RepID=UPI00068BD040|nr:tyrosine-protein kinase family protein [Psychroserpens jangbogonensis]